MLDRHIDIATPQIDSRIAEVTLTVPGAIEIRHQYRVSGIGQLLCDRGKYVA